MKSIPPGKIQAPAKPRMKYPPLWPAFIAEQTDIHAKKWIQETDRDPELNLLKQAFIDRSSK